MRTVLTFEYNAACAALTHPEANLSDLERKALHEVVRCYREHEPMDEHTFAKATSTLRSFRQSDLVAVA